VSHTAAERKFRIADAVALAQWSPRADVHHSLRHSPGLACGATTWDLGFAMTQRKTLVPGVRLASP
jgi:hypothetical protein